LSDILPIVAVAAWGFAGGALAGLYPFVEVAAWGFAGGALAGLYPFIQASKVPKSQRVDKGRLFYIINFVGLPVIGAFIACLAKTQCSEIDPVMATFAGYAAPSLLQKWQNDDLML
jgi:hypothetical protein